MKNSYENLTNNQFQNIKLQISAHKKNGDIKKVLEQTGYSRPVYNSAIKKDNLFDLTIAEEEVICTLHSLIIERINKYESLTK